MALLGNTSAFDTIFKSEFMNDELTNKKCYIWGAGSDGIRVYKEIKNLIQIIGFIDSDPHKKGSKIDECNIYDFDHFKKLEKGAYKILIATSRFEVEIANKLQSEGYERDIDFCGYKKFYTAYNWLFQQKVYSSFVATSVTQKCTLSCEKCGHLMPSFKSPRNRPLSEIKLDIDAYFNWVDQVGTFCLAGGEPFLHPEILEIVEYIGQSWGKKISMIQIVTNGTMVPSEDILLACKQYNVTITVSDYSVSVPRLKKSIDNLVNVMEKYDVSFLKKNPTSTWVDLGFPKTDNSNMTEHQIIDFFDQCNSQCRELYNQKLYFCSIQPHAIQAGLFKDDVNDYFDLQDYDSSKRIKFLEFDQGYTELGYITFCKKCNSFASPSAKIIPAAKQTRDRIKL